jgi:hypothetical protein
VEPTGFFRDDKDVTVVAAVGQTWRFASGSATCSSAKSCYRRQHTFESSPAATSTWGQNLRQRAVLGLVIPRCRSIRDRERLLAFSFCCFHNFLVGSAITRRRHADPMPATSLELRPSCADSQQAVTRVIERLCEGKLI